MKIAVRMDGNMENIALPGKIKNILTDFVHAIKGIYKDGLVSVILYGSAARGDFSRRYSNINLAVVLRDASLDNLKRASGVMNKRCFRRLFVIFLTEEYMNRSRDVFPIEFLDMKENNMPLYGKDVLEGLEVDMRNLRFQCEQELKAKLINIKRQYLMARGAAALRGLVFKHLTSSLHIFRNLIRLKGGSPDYLKRDLLQALGREFEIDTGVFGRILEAKNKNLSLSYREAEALLFGFAAELEKAISSVDRL